MFLIVSQPVNKKPEFLKITSRATIRNIQIHVTEFSTELLMQQFLAVLKIRITLTGNIHLQRTQFSVKL